MNNKYLNYVFYGVLIILLIALFFGLMPFFFANIIIAMGGAETMNLSVFGLGFVFTIMFYYAVFEIG